MVFGDADQRCADVQGLDLTKNLLPTWDTVALIAKELVFLERLALKCAFHSAIGCNFMSTITQSEPSRPAFRSSTYGLGFHQSKRAPVERDFNRLGATDAAFASFDA